MTLRTVLSLSGAVSRKPLPSGSLPDEPLHNGPAQAPAAPSLEETMGVPGSMAACRQRVQGQVGQPLTAAAATAQQGHSALSSLKLVSKPRAKQLPSSQHAEAARAARRNSAVQGLASSVAQPDTPAAQRADNAPYYMSQQESVDPGAVSVPMAAGLNMSQATPEAQLLLPSGSNGAASPTGSCRLSLRLSDTDDELP